MIKYLTMYKNITFLMAFLFLMSCSVRKQPEFIKIDSIKVVNVTPEKIVLKAVAIFENPNDIGGKIETNGIKVLVNDVEVAEVKAEQFKIPAKKEFSVPMLVDIPLAKLQGKSGSNFLENLIGTLLNQNLKVQFKGKLKYKVLGYSSSYDIDETEIVKVKF